MFDALTDRFDGIFKRLRGHGRLTEADVDEVLREIRLALLEADVNFKVVRDLVARIRERCVGSDLHGALNPAQQVIDIVHQELIATLGGETLRITYASKPPTVVLMAGLQGSGKTTNSAKLARWFKQQGRNPLLVARRPPAPRRRRSSCAPSAEQVGVPVFSAPDDIVASGQGDPVLVAEQAMAEAKRLGRDVVIVDTAGRLSIDAELMDQVRRIEAVTSPDYTFLVVDAMTGQDAVTTAENFHQTLELDGVILTKLDGDARGGAALSVKEVVGKPIAFASTGEKLEDFDLFHPDRLAGRILGMGDVLTLIEQAKEHFDEAEAEEAAARLLEGKFTFEDFLEQMQQMKKMGSMNKILGMLPGVPKEIRNVDIDDREIARLEGMIRAMTPAERREPDLIDGSRRLRIANGSGTTTSEVNQLLKQFKEVQRMMKGLGVGPGRGKKGKKKGKGGGRVTRPGPPAAVGKGGLPGLKLPDKPEFKLPGLP